jgi:hypothetical protein
MQRQTIPPKSTGITMGYIIDQFGFFVMNGSPPSAGIFNIQAGRINRTIEIALHRITVLIGDSASI